ncbi:MAG: DUF456 domain-containing protein [Acidimicrobiia bacterium]
MSAVGEFVVGLLLLLGVAGTVLPILPGLALELGAVFVWALVEGTPLAWAIAVAALAIAAAGTVVKYLVPGRRLKAAGIPRVTLYFAGGLAIVGFFVVPVVGAPLGFVLGVYLAERRRVGPGQAWPSTTRSLQAVALSVGIELAAGLLVLGLWLAAVLFWT